MPQEPQAFGLGFKNGPFGAKGNVAPCLFSPYTSAKLFEGSNQLGGRGSGSSTTRKRNRSFGSAGGTGGSGAPISTARPTGGTSYTGYGTPNVRASSAWWACAWRSRSR